MKKLVILISVFILTMMTASPAMAGGGNGMRKVTVINKADGPVKMEVNYRNGTIVETTQPSETKIINIPGANCPSFCMAQIVFDSMNTWTVWPSDFYLSGVMYTYACYDTTVTITGRYDVETYRATVTKD